MKHKLPILLRGEYWIFLAYLAILPLANTTALRNVFLLTLVCLVGYHFFFTKFSVEKELELRSVPLPLVLWFCFLIFFPLWAEQSDIAWINFKGQWGQSILAWSVGIGVALILGRQGPSLWGLAVASSLPVVIHLSLTLLAWLGAFGVNVPDSISIGEIWISLIHMVDSLVDGGSVSRGFPWGFRGYDPMHGNLGYAACQAIVLFMVCADVAWQKDQRIRFWAAVAAITFCFLSVLIASSRGAVFFGIVMLSIAFVAIYFRNLKRRITSKKRNSRKSIFRLLFGMLISFIFVGAFFVKIVGSDPRWVGVVDKISVGFDIENPIDFLCNGLSLADREKIKYRYRNELPKYSDELIGGMSSDGGRVVLMRAGFSLIFENWHGIDGSRSTYERLIENKCGHPPVMHFAHTHQAWMDVILALGLVGGLLLAWVFIFFMLEGWRDTMRLDFSAWAFALFLISMFWVLRGFMDSVYREHYLQMQAITISYLYFRKYESVDAG